MATHDAVLGTLLGSFSLAQDAGVRIGFDGLVCLSFAQQISDSVNYSGSPLDGAAFLTRLLLSRVGQFACHKKGLEQAGQRGRNIAVETASGSVRRCGAKLCCVRIRFQAFCSQV